MDSLRSNRFWILTALVLLVAALRVALVEVPNVSPIAAIALFGGAYFRSRWMGLLVPVFALFLGDLFMELFIPQFGFHGLWPFTYGAFALIAIIGFALRGKVSPVRVGAAGLTGAILFFVISNFGVWAMDTVMFTKDFAGLMACYEFALPFFRGTLVGDLFFVAFLFGVFELAKKRVPALA